MYAVLDNTLLEVAGVVLKRAITLLNIPLRNSLLYSNTPEIFFTLLYSSNHFHLNTLLYSTRVLKFQYFTQHCNVGQTREEHVNKCGFKCEWIREWIDFLSRIKTNIDLLL